VVSIQARDASLALVGQVLIYPAVDFPLSHRSHSETDRDAIMTGAAIRWFRDHYLNDAADVDHWKASPGRVTALAGLPPAFVLTAGVDPL